MILGRTLREVINRRSQGVLKDLEGVERSCRRDRISGRESREEITKVNDRKRETTETS